jgi:hypothetical protein
MRLCKEQLFLFELLYLLSFPIGHGSSQQANESPRYSKDFAKL